MGVEALDRQWFVFLGPVPASVSNMSINGASECWHKPDWLSFSRLAWPSPTRAMESRMHQPWSGRRADAGLHPRRADSRPVECKEWHHRPRCRPLFHTPPFVTLRAKGIPVYRQSLPTCACLMALVSSRYSPNHACWSPWTSIAKPKSASLTAAFFDWEASSKFSGWIIKLNHMSMIMVICMRMYLDVWRHMHTYPDCHLIGW